MFPLQHVNQYQTSTSTRRQPVPDDAPSARAAQEETHLLVISRDKLIMLCETYPQLGYRLMYNLAADIAMKIRNTDLRIREQLLYKSQEDKK